MIPEYSTTLPTYAAESGLRAAHTPDRISALALPASGHQISQNTELVGFYGQHASRECTLLHKISWVFLWIFLSVNPMLHVHCGRRLIFFHSFVPLEGTRVNPHGYCSNATPVPFPLRFTRWSYAFRYGRKLPYARFSRRTRSGATNTLEPALGLSTPR